MIKSLLKQSYQATPIFLTSLICKLTFTGKKSSRALVIENFLSSLFHFSKRIILFCFFRKEVRLVTKFVEEKYDKLAGDYISKFENESSELDWYYVDNEVKQVPSSQYYHCVIEEYIGILSSLSFQKILEVGTGELTTILSIAKHFGSTLEYYGMDLSLNRVHLGYQYFENKCQFPVSVCKANATHLPYRDSYFDLVFTSFCLEHMPYDYQKAIDEMVRVSRVYVVLFEPLSELANFSQKMNMFAKGYVRGILNYLNSLQDIKVERVFRLKTGKLFNRGSCILIKLSKENTSTNEESYYVCPICKNELEDLQKSFFCNQCSRVFLKFGNIPIFDDLYSFYIKKESPILNLASKT